MRICQHYRKQIFLVNPISKCLKRPYFEKNINIYQGMIYLFKL